MWFKRKPKNRRIERPQLLDVKLRSSQVRVARLRFAGIALGIVFGLVATLFVLWRGGEWALNVLVYENEAFAIQQIDVQTDGAIAPENFRRWAMVKPGQNLLALDLMRVKRDLELVPWVQSASVERVLPRTLRLRISEREPVAQVVAMQTRSQGGYEAVVFHLDQTGFVMLPLDARLRSTTPVVQNDAFPILSGVPMSDLRIGRRVESTQARAAIDLIEEFDRSPMAGLAQIQRINVTVPEVLEVYTTHGTEIVFSLNSFPTQLNRWRLVYDQYQKLGKTIAMLDLSIANNVPLRFVEGNPIVPAAKSKTTRTRKKNV